MLDNLSSDIEDISNGPTFKFDYKAGNLKR